MPRFYLNALILLPVMIPVSVGASSRLYDADAIVSLRNGKPCFAYTPSKEKLFGYSLSVTRLDAPHTIVWEIHTYAPGKKSTAEPSSPEACIEYGGVHSDMEVRHAAEQLVPDTPYRVFFSVAEAPVGEGRYRYLRKSGSEFCVGSNEQGESIIVSAESDGTGGWRCGKAGERPKRGFWRKLFGE